ncbi:transposase [Actinosynnema sp. NPDC051121]
MPLIVRDRARMRADLGVLRTGDEIAVDLRTLTRRRTDLVNDRARQINRLRDQLLEFFLALERGLSLTNKGPVRLLAGCQAPAAIRRSGAKRIETWLRNRGGEAPPRSPWPQSRQPWSSTPCFVARRWPLRWVARIAKGLGALDEEIVELDTPIETRFRRHRHAEVILSLPGMGVRLAAEFSRRSWRTRDEAENELFRCSRRYGPDTAGQVSTTCCGGAPSIRVTTATTSRSCAANGTSVTSGVPGRCRGICGLGQGRCCVTSRRTRTGSTRWSASRSVRPSTVLRCENCGRCWSGTGCSCGCRRRRGRWTSATRA